MSVQPSYLTIDFANYNSLGTLLKTLGSQTIANVKPISSIIKATDFTKKNIFHRPDANDIFMGLYASHLHYAHSNSIRITLEEISIHGKKGPTFYLTLYSTFSEEWQKNPALAKMLGSGKTLLLFKNISFQLKTNEEVQFHLTSSKYSPWLNVKNYFTNSDSYTYLPLSSAAEQLTQKCNIYGVVHSILKIPETVSKGRGHGMYLLVDPSCYENMIKVREYRAHIFCSSVSVFPTINKGDVIRLHRVITERRPKDGLSDFRIYREADFVIFPWNDNETPRSVGRFTFTEEDFAYVKRLKTWSLERYRNNTTTTAVEAKIITMNDIKPDEVFNLPCRLVDFFDEGKGVAMWVEDGTRCPLYTCSDSNIQPYDSQATQDICKDCLRICIRCSKQLLADLKLEQQMLLFLKEVHPSSQNCQAEDNITVVQFEIKGSVEALPQSTRYHKSLMQRLNKITVLEPAALPDNHPKNLSPQPLTIQSPRPLKTPSPQPLEIQSPQQQEIQTPRQPEIIEKKRSERSKLKSIPKTSVPLEVQKCPEENSKVKSDRTASVQLEGQDRQEDNSKVDSVPTPSVELVVRSRTKGKRKLKPVPASSVPLEVRNRLKEVRISLKEKSKAKSVPSEEKECPEEKSTIKPVQKSRVPSKEVNLMNSREEGTEMPKTISNGELVASDLKSSSNPKDHIISSGESSTDRAMIEIPSDYFDFAKPKTPNNLVLEDLNREARRLHLLVHPEIDEQEVLLSRPSAESQQLGSIEDMTFSQVIASTQKPQNIETDDCLFSQEIPNAQRLFIPETEVESQSLPKISNCNFDSPMGENSQSGSLSCSLSASPHPEFRAVNEILSVKTNYSLSDENSNTDENQLNLSIDAPLFRNRNTEGDQVVNVEMESNKETNGEIKKVTSSIKLKRMNTRNTGKDKLKGDDQREEIILTIGKTSQMDPNPSRRKRSASQESELPASKVCRIRTSSGDSSDSSSVVEIYQECSQDSQDSDKDSIFIFDPLSQDLEKVLCAVEEAGPQELYLTNLDDETNTLLGEHFKVTAHLTEILPKQFDVGKEFDLKNLLVAFCPECNHLWQYNHFIDSISMKVCKPRNPRRVPQKLTAQEESGQFSKVINYLCSEEEHDRNMQILAESTNPSIIEQFDSDGEIFKDYSYFYICPLCKSRGIPDSLSQLQPSFFFWLHLTQQVEETTKCFHVMVSGVHAEYFLGTKADYVLRSPEIWKRAEGRISKLLVHQQPITLLLRRLPSSGEVCLEYTYVVYTSNQLIRL